MSRRRVASPIRSAIPPNACRTVLPIDEGPIRKDALRKFRRILTQRQKAQAELDRFKQQDLPAFQQWVSALFGVLMTEMRQEEERLFELRDILEEVEAEAFLSGVSEDEAYRRVKERREKRAAGEDGDDFASGRDDDGEEEDEDEFDEEARAEFREHFGCDPEDFAREQHERRLNELGGKAARNGVGDEVKDLYRKLVRKLHPDMNGEVEEKKKELWHAVQEAYRCGDYGRLRELAAQCDEGEEEVVGINTPVSRLLSLWESARAALRTIRAEIRRARDDPAWNFSEKSEKERERAVADMREEFGEHIEQRRTLRQDLEEQIAIWEEMCASRSRRAPREPKDDVPAGPFEEIRYQRAPETRARRRSRSRSREPDPAQMRFSF